MSYVIYFLFTFEGKSHIMSHDANKTVFRVSDQVKHKPACAGKENSQKLEILNLRRREIVKSLHS